ncbi:MAG: SIMPL domain-containing protein, partial [Thermoleophilaceae bacterium]
AVVTYVGIYDLSIRTRRVDLLSQLFSILTRAKVDYEGPSFDLADPTGADIRARDVALDDARRRADDAAARIGMSVVGVRNVNLNPELIGTSLPSGDEGQALFPERAPAAGGSPSTGVTVKRTPIAGGTIEVSADVIVIYVLG